MSDINNPDGTAIYQLSSVPAGATSRVYWYDANSSSPTLAAGSNANLSVGSGGGSGPKPLVIANGTSTTPVYIGLQVKDSNNTLLMPLGIVIRRSGGGNPNDPQGVGTFPTVSINTSTCTMVLCDNEDDKANFDFDILFADASGKFGLLDPKLQNS